ncbi:NADPH:quinone reductase [Williamsia sp. Leaf354]|uniref:NADP-dependent oxidoreductase n=1 Tax=Williamsia sp. Leaf354 TaxID=1736349 RepID=UPI0006F4D8EE|nr:NADP-dependent oxidoreductase [Williamsia sp. Leaf354]KQR99753.1 NADPH:quinone reductase [Williamsia sp. Leaf354]
MKALRFHEYGSPDTLRYEEVDRPEPAEGQVRIRVAATSFNSVDGTIRAGAMQGPIPVDLPHVPGLDVAGVVDALGDGADRFAVGDRVIGFLPFAPDGASAEYVVAAVDGLTPAPTSIPLADAAALPLVGLTAWQALFDHAGLQAGQRILINGAGGAVGGYAVQLAAAAGAHVVATAGPSSRARVMAAGAHEIVDHTATDLLAAVTEPVDVLLNLASIDSDRLTALAGLVGDGGVVVNTTVWMPAPADPARGVRGVDMYVRSDAAQLAELATRVDRGELTVDVAERVSLTGVIDVHARAAQGQISGKVVVVVDDTVG